MNATSIAGPDPLLIEAIRAIAGFCDGASSDDGIGFSGTDTRFGKALAQIPGEIWTPEATREAWEMLRKYRGQLSRAGIDYDQIEEPTAPEEPKTVRAIRFIDLDSEGQIFIRVPYGDPAEPKTTLSARWDPSEKRWIIPERAYDRIRDISSKFEIPVSSAALSALSADVPEKPLGTVSLDDQRILLQFDYDPLAVGSVKEIPGRAWDPNRKIWTAPITSIRAVRTFAQTYRLDLSPEIETLPDCEPQNRPLIEVQGGEFLLRFDYDRDIVARVRDLPGARWSPSTKVWKVDLEATIEVADFAISTEAIIGSSASQILEDAREALARIEASEAADADLDIPGLGGDLLPFQRAGVSYALRAMGFQQDDSGIWRP